MSKTTCHSAHTTACTASMQTQPLELLYWFSLRVCERGPRCMKGVDECGMWGRQSSYSSSFDEHINLQRESVRTGQLLAKAKMPLANTQGISASQSFSHSNLKSPCAPNQMRSTQRSEAIGSREQTREESRRRGEEEAEVGPPTTTTTPRSTPRRQPCSAVPYASRFHRGEGEEGEGRFEGCGARGR